MRFSYTKEQELLRKSFTEYLNAKCTSEERKNWISNEEGYSKKVWREISELGWPGLLFDEKYGGMSGSFLEMFILFEQIGKSLLPSPLYSSAVLAGMLIDSAGSQEQKAKYLPGLIDGNLVFSFAYLDVNGQCDVDAPSVSAVPVENGAYCLGGSCILVPYCNTADKVMVYANVSKHEKTGPSLFLLDTKSPGVECSPLLSISNEKLFALRFDKAKVEQEDVFGEIGNGSTHICDMLLKATTLKCAEMLGGLKKVVEMTVAHVKERRQFGKPLGTFQVIQHYCTDMTTDLEGGRLLANQAASLLDLGEPCEKEVAMAKAWLSDAYPRCCFKAHQMLGAYGFTEECDLYLWTKHAKTSDLVFGHSWLQRSKVAKALEL